MQQQILLVDDDPDYLLLLGNLLSNEGLSVRTTTRGEDALTYLEQQTFHLLITDLHMPRMDGLTLARKATVIAPDVAIIMCSGSISAELPEMAEAAGIGTVLSKTAAPEEILAAIREATGARKGMSRVGQGRK